METQAKPLQGPRGLSRNGETVTRSQFARFERNGRTGWQWVAFDDANPLCGRPLVLHVIELPDQMDGFYDTPNGALWALRGCAASYFHDVRSHRGH